MKPPPLSAWRASATAAHVAPFAVFMAFLMLPGSFRVENPELPWHIRAPELWVYPLQTLTCAALLLFFSPHYSLRPWRGLPLALLLGILGILLWLTPAWLYTQLRPAEPPAWWAWLGLVDRTQGFDPTQLAPWPIWEKASLLLRLARLTLLVPLLEEIFWRGYLMRWLAAEGRPWTHIPFGTHTWRSYFITTALVTLAHQPEDWAAAFLWGSLVYYTAVRTRSLGACVLMHATANAILGWHILTTQQWGFW